MLFALLTLLACPRQEPLEGLIDLRPPPLNIPDDPDPLSAVTVPDLPLWTNKYADTREQYGRFFNISALMHEHQLSRLEAVELQNHFRDAIRADPHMSVLSAFSEALHKVKRGELESGLDAARLDKAPFIVVFDLDDTLYDQYYSAELGAQCHTVSWPRESGDKHIQMAPGWDATIGAIRELGGEVVLFSANLDESTLENLRHIELGDTPLLGHPDIAGVMTNSFLVMQEKSEGPGADKARAGQPVPTPSKDLRIVDEGLTKVIIVDDNPTRLFQPANTRVFRKFHADQWCASELDAAQKKGLQSGMAVVETEIRDSVAAMAEHELDFATAYLPYTRTGQVAAAALAHGNGWVAAGEAVRYLRLHPELADREF